MGDVLEIRPKTLNKRYKNHSYMLIFDKESKQWSWEVTYVETTIFKGELKPTMNAAMRAAEKHIDKTLEIKG